MSPVREPVYAGPSGEEAGAAGRGAGWAGGTAGRPRASPTGKHVYENSDIFCVRTPISMILGLLESEQQALQLYT